MATKTIFISFDYDNDRRYKNLLVAWDTNKVFDFRFYDGSVTAPVNSTNATYIRSQIKPKIQTASHLLCIVGRYSARSEWIRWEIETAVALRKKLIGVKLDRSFTSPAALLNNNAKWAMSFTFDSIRTAVNSA